MSRKRINEQRYAFRSGNRYSVGADVAGVELARIQQAYGAVTPATVVDEARPEEAPLHPVFEWDDSVAAEHYRVWQARRLIKSVEVIVEDDKREPVYVHVPKRVESDAGGYQPVSVVVNRPDMYALALADLTRRVRAAQEAVEALQRAASESPETDQERMARIAIAVQAMQTASAAVSALH